MLARAVNVQFQPDKVKEASRIVREEIVPAMEELDGFEGQFLLMQRDTGQAISLKLWETEDALTAFESSSLYGELMGRLSGVLAGPPEGEQYDVAVEA